MHMLLMVTYDTMCSTTIKDYFLVNAFNHEKIIFLPDWIQRMKIDTHCGHRLQEIVYLQTFYFSRSAFRFQILLDCHYTYVISSSWAGLPNLLILSGVSWFLNFFPDQNSPDFRSWFWRFSTDFFWFSKFSCLFDSINIFKWKTMWMNYRTNVLSVKYSA